MDARTTLSEVHGTLGQAIGLLGDPVRAVEAASLLLDAYQVAGAGLGAALEPTGAAAMHAVWEQPVTHQLRSGRVVRYVPLSLTAELLAGTLPNRLLVHVLGWEHTPQNDGDRRKQAIEEIRLLLNIARRSLIEPRLVLPEDDRQPMIERGEIGPADLRPDELREVRDLALYSVLPEVAAAPFRDSDHAPGGTGPT